MGIGAPWIVFAATPEFREYISIGSTFCVFTAGGILDAAVDVAVRKRVPFVIFFD